MRCTLWLVPAMAVSLLACGYSPQQTSGGADSGAGKTGGGSSDAAAAPVDGPLTENQPGEDAAQDRPIVPADANRADTGGVGVGGSGGGKGSGADTGGTLGSAGTIASSSTGGTGGLTTTAAGGTTNKGGSTAIAGTTAASTGTGGTASSGGLTGTAGSGGVASTGGTSAGGATGGTGGATGGSGGSSTGGTIAVTECPPDPASLVGTCTANGSKWANWTIAPKESFLLTSEDLVIDNTTGLTWQRKVAGRTSASCTGPVRLTRDQAMCYCSALSLPGATYGWRLPTRAELMTIVLFGNGSPAIDLQAFPGTTAASFWTSSTSPDGKGAWDVYFGNGAMNNTGDLSAMNLVRCVRGSHDSSGEHYTLGTGALAGTVLDNGTQLRWQTKPIGPKTGDELAQICAASTLGQLTWRLPTIMELISLVDDTRTDPAFDKTVFEGGSDDYHSTTQDNGGLGVGFWWGQTEGLPFSSKGYGRCVSSK